MINTLVQFNDALFHLPVGALVGLFAICIGYVFKSAAWFPNNKIPAVVVSFTALIFPLLQFCADMGADKTKPGWSIPLNVVYGTVIGCLAWLFHRRFLKRWIDPKIFDDSNTNQNQPKEP